MNISRRGWRGIMVISALSSLILGMSASAAYASSHRTTNFPIVSESCPVDTSTNLPSCLSELDGRDSRVRDVRIVATTGGPAPLVIGTGWWCVSSPHSVDGQFCKTIVWWCTDDGSACGTTAGPQHAQCFKSVCSFGRGG